MYSWTTPWSNDEESVTSSKISYNSFDDDCYSYYEEEEAEETASYYYEDEDSVCSSDEEDVESLDEDDSDVPSISDETALILKGELLMDDLPFFGLTGALVNDIETEYYYDYDNYSYDDEEECEEDDTKETIIIENFDQVKSSTRRRDKLTKNNKDDDVDDQVTQPSTSTDSTTNLDKDEEELEAKAKAIGINPEQPAWELLYDEESSQELIKDSFIPISDDKDDASTAGQEPLPTKAHAAEKIFDTSDNADVGGIEKNLNLSQAGCSRNSGCDKLADTSELPRPKVKEVVKEKITKHKKGEEHYTILVNKKFLTIINDNIDDSTPIVEVLLAEQNNYKPKTNNITNIQNAKNESTNILSKNAQNEATKEINNNKTNEGAISGGENSSANRFGWFRKGRSKKQNRSSIPVNVTKEKTTQELKPFSSKQMVREQPKIKKHSRGFYVYFGEESRDDGGSSRRRPQRC